MPSQRHGSGSEETHEEVERVKIETEDLQGRDQEEGEARRPREIGGSQKGVPLSGCHRLSGAQVDCRVPVHLVPGMDQEEQAPYEPEAGDRGGGAF